MERSQGKFLWALVAGFLWVGPAFSQGGEGMSWRERIKNQKVPYIADYHWMGTGLPEELTREFFQDYLRMGFTGVQKEDHGGGGRLFLEHGLHGFMWQTYWSHPDPVRKKDGSVVHPHPHLYGCLSSEANIKAGAECILQFIRERRQDLKVIDGYYIFSAWDEVGLQPQYSQTYCQCSHCSKLFRIYLQENVDAETGYKDWDEVTLPQFEDRFSQPLLWKYFIDFTAWKTARFFTRIEEEVNKTGEPMTWMVFYHSSMFWPGAGPQQGITPYYHARSSSILINEFCISNWPVSVIASAWNNRLSRSYGRGVFDYSWFWPGRRDDGDDLFVEGEGSYERALARKMGNTLHGLLFWYYNPPIYHHLPKIYQEIAHWHHFLQKHWDFLKEAEPTLPEIAILWPGYSSYYYSLWLYPKTDFGWAPQAFLEGQYPFTVVQEEEVEAGILQDYRALYVFSVERTSKRVLEEIEKFIEQGGYVFTNADSLLMEIDGNRSNLLEKHFGVSLKKKYKSTFWPSILSAEDDAWARDILPDKTWAQTIKDIKRVNGQVPPPPVSTPSGLQQEALDPDKIHTISLNQDIVPAGKVRTHHDIVTGSATGGEVRGTFRGETVAVETKQTLWFGNRPGFDVYATFPEDVLAAWGEPLYALHRNPTTRIAQRSDYRRIITHLAEKAKIKRPAVVSRAGAPAPHIEVAVKEHPLTKGKMVFLINQDEIGGQHEVTIADILKGFEAWDVTANRLIEKKTDGKFTVEIKPLRARVLFVGPPGQARRISRNQRELLAMDLLPTKFTLGPKTLSEPPLPQVEPVPEPEVSVLNQGESARLTVVVRNSDEKKPRLQEPIIIPASTFTFRLGGTRIKGVRLITGEPVQWDDLNGDGFLSSGDEIVWQTNLLPGEEKRFVLVLLDELQEVSKKEGFSLLVGENEAKVVLEGKEIFVVGEDNSWRFPTAKMEAELRQRFGTHPGARFFMDGEIKEPEIKVLSDGAVRKLISVTHSYQPLPRRFSSPSFFEHRGEPVERAVKTTARYALYAGQVPGEERIYALIEHKVEQDFTESKDFPYRLRPCGGRLAGLSTEALGGWYKDTLGRVASLSVYYPYMEKNFGGWLAIRQGEGTLLGILARRTEGVVASRPVPDERDGIQLFGTHLTRSLVNWHGGDVRTFVDREIMAGNRFILECLLVLKEGDSWEGIDELRQKYAKPPSVEIREWTVGRKELK